MNVLKPLTMLLKLFEKTSVIAVQATIWTSNKRSACDKILMLVATSASGTHTCLPSTPTPSQLVTAAQSLVTVFSPRYDHTGRLLSLSSSQETWRRILDSKLNSSVLLLSTYRKFCQISGMAAFPTTRLLTPFPHLALVVPFREWSLYVCKYDLTPWEAC